MAALVDVAASVLITVMLWPFPIARATLSPAAHVIDFALASVVVQLAYHAASAAGWRQTAGMRLAGLALRSTAGDELPRARGIVWGLAAGLLAPWYLVHARSAARAALPERLSGMALVESPVGADTT